MREIKFRAWSKTQNRMFRWGEILSMNLNNVFMGEQYSGLELQQFTGLHDKNGKEIYEGDIVQINDHPFHGSMNINGNYQVHYNVYMELCCGSLLLFRQLPYVTIIGNIYENPELLEGEQ